MKYIIGILAISLVFVSCEKKANKTRILPVELSIADAFDSMNLQYNTFYRLAIRQSRSVVADSSSAIRFNSFQSITEYKTHSDTTGFHLDDSVTYTIANKYAVYQQPDPNFYQSTIGSVKIYYYPVGGGGSSFRVRDHLNLDTLIMSVGVGSESYIGTGYFNGMVTGGSQLDISFFR